MFKRIIICIFCIVLQFKLAYNQQSIGVWQQFWKLSCPEKKWAVFHPFVAKKAWKYSLFARESADSLKSSILLDGDADGGQVDAFRHAYWMALLTKHIGAKKAKSLGIAHEKGNYLDFKKHRLEDGSLPDKKSSEMDLWNNGIGIEIAINNRCIQEDALKIIVIQYIKCGKMKIIRKNNRAEFLDINFQIIPSDSLRGKWENDKVLDNSNYKYNK